MKNPLFIVTHLGSGVEYLCSILNENERVQIFNEIISFDHPNSLERLFANNHKVSNASAIYGTVNYFNKDFSCKSFYTFSKFIYVIREPTPSLQIILNKEKFLLGAFRYYCFRLRRIYEMARNTPGAILINYQSLLDNKDLSSMQKYLYLKQDLKYPEISPEYFEEKPIKEFKKLAQDVFEKYFYKLRNLDLEVI